MIDYSTILNLHTSQYDWESNLDKTKGRVDFKFNRPVNETLSRDYQEAYYLAWERSLGYAKY